MKKTAKIFFNPCIVLLIILASALVLRCLRCTQDPILSRDGCLYLESAVQWSCGYANPNVFHAPLYIGILKFLISHCQNVERAIVWFQIGFSVLTILLVFLTFRNFFHNERIALFGAFLCAFSPYLIRESIEIQRETLFFFFLWVTLYFSSFLRLENLSLLKSFFCGFLCASGAYFTCLFRSEGCLIFFAVIGMPILLLYESRKTSLPQKRILRFLISAAGILSGLFVTGLLLALCGFNWQYQLQQAMEIVHKAIYYLK